MKLSDYTLSLLNDIENRIDPETEEDFFAQWLRFWNGEVEEPSFIPNRKSPTPSAISIKSININDALHDKELMKKMGRRARSAYKKDSEDAVVDVIARVLKRG